MQQGSHTNRFHSARFNFNPTSSTFQPLGVNRRSKTNCTASLGDVTTCAAPVQALNHSCSSRFSLCLGLALTSINTVRGCPWSSMNPTARSGNPFPTWAVDVTEQPACVRNASTICEWFASTFAARLATVDPFQIGNGAEDGIHLLRDNGVAQRPEPIDPVLDADSHARHVRFLAPA
jgi:hypothetical protein